MQFFNRKAIVQIGAMGEIGTEIKDLRVSFTVKKTSTKDYNSAKVQIYNLSPQTRDAIKDTEDLLVLKVGYAESQEVIFTGSIAFVNTTVDRPQVVTTIDAYDGYKTAMDGWGGERNQMKILSLSYVAGTSVKKILNDAIDASGMPVKNRNLIVAVPDRQYVNGFCFIGTGKVLFENLCMYLGLEWSVQNGELKFSQVEQSDYVEVAHLTPETGLIGSPDRQKDEASNPNAKKRKKHKAPGGWKIKAVLQPKIEPGSLVVVNSTEIKTDTRFRVVTVEHNGDTHGNNWFTTMDVIEA
jgi:hypothetical protein